MDASDLFAKVFSIGQGIYDAERTRRRSKQRSAELKEQAEKVISVGSTATQMPPETGNVGDKSQKEKQPPILASQSGIELPTSEETKQELKRRLAKELYRAELDLGAKLRIAGKPCDCLGYKHSLEIEATAEEMIAQEPNNKVYFEIIEWLKRNQPKVSIEAIRTGQYDNEYPRMAAEFKDFRKRVMGTTATNALLRPEKRISIQEAKAEAAKLAEQEVEKLWKSPTAAEPPPAVIPTEPQRRPRRETDLEYLADSPEYLAETIDNTGYRSKLDNAFQEAIARVKGLK